MFIYHQGSVYEVPGIKHRYLTGDEQEDWFGTDECEACEKWLSSHVYVRLGEEEFYAFIDRRDLMDGIKLEKLKAVRTLNNINKKHKGFKVPNDE